MSQEGYVEADGGRAGFLLCRRRRWRRRGTAALSARRPALPHDYLEALGRLGGGRQGVFL
jgi:hypothetical protein